MDDILVFILIIFLAPCAVFVGKLMDMTWRVYFLRLVTKEDWHILAFATKDKKQLFRYAVNPKHSVFIFRGMMFIVENGRVYREKKIEDGWLLAKAPRTSDEGVPTIFCDADSMRPLVFEGHGDPVKPSEIGTAITSWIENQENENTETKNKIFMVCCMILGVALLLGILIYIQGQQLVDLQTRLYPIEYKLGVRVVNATIGENATLNIPT